MAEASGSKTDGPITNSVEADIHTASTSKITCTVRKRQIHKPVQPGKQTKKSKQTPKKKTKAQIQMLNDQPNGC